MKNSNVSKILNLMAVIVLTALPAYCMQTLKQTAVKFAFAMVGVVVSCLIIYVGLITYNRLFLKNDVSNDEKKTSTHQKPDNISDAVDFFIIKNKLR